MINYCDDIQCISENQLGGFFVGWRKPLSTVQHYKLLCGSTYFVVAVDDENDKVVGFITGTQRWGKFELYPIIRSVTRLSREWYRHKSGRKNTTKT